MPLFDVILVETHTATRRLRVRVRAPDPDAATIKATALPLKRFVPTDDAPTIWPAKRRHEITLPKGDRYK